MSSKSEMIKEYIFNYEEVIFNISYVVSHNYLTFHLLIQQRSRPKHSYFSQLSSAPLAISTASAASDTISRKIRYGFARI